MSYQFKVEKMENADKIGTHRFCLQKIVGGSPRIEATVTIPYKSVVTVEYMKLVEDLFEELCGLLLPFMSE